VGDRGSGPEPKGSARASARSNCREVVANHGSGALADVVEGVLAALPSGPKFA
jgi:hypothetical protein